MKNKKNHTNILIIIVAVIFIISLIAALIFFLNKDDKKEDSNNNATSSTITTTDEPTDVETTTSTKSTAEAKTTIKNSSSTSKKTTTSKSTKVKTTTGRCNLEELEQIADKNRPDKYAVWKTKPTFDVPSSIEYGIGYQKFFWMWYQIGTKNGEPYYIWVVASDKESGMGYPSGEGNTIHEMNPSGHFKNAMKYMIAKPTTDGTKPGERRGEVSLYFYTGTTSVICR